MQSSQTQIVVLGIGQPFRGDDGVGLAAVTAWKQAYPSTAANPILSIQEEPLPGLSLLSLLADYQAAILVDAVQSGAPPGTLHTLQIDELEAFSTAARFAHGWGLAETLRLGQIIAPSFIPKRLQILGIEAIQFDLGHKLSPAVRVVLPQAAARIQEFILQVLLEVY